MEKIGWRGCTGCSAPESCPCRLSVFTCTETPLQRFTSMSYVSSILPFYTKFDQNELGFWSHRRGRCFACFCRPIMLQCPKIYPVPRNKYGNRPWVHYGSEIPFAHRLKASSAVLLLPLYTIQTPSLQKYWLGKNGSLKIIDAVCPFASHIWGYRLILGAVVDA